MNVRDASLHSLHSLQSFSIILGIISSKPTIIARVEVSFNRIYNKTT